VCWDLHWRHIAAPTLAHIHGPAPAGSNAPVLVGFISGAPPFTLDRLENTSHASGCTTTTPVNAAAIVAHPDQYYVNIHNGRFPTGAVRGQMG
jgi:hypothetical protein